jgi:membrane-bound lytic murein transglycosylase A
MEQNPSYVFFRKLPPSDGPIGAEGIGLTPKRSLAVDKHFIPLGLPLFLQTTLPDDAGFNRLMIAQDIGGAIKGPVRGDIFFGRGKQAEWLAGMMKARGHYVLLLPNEIAEGL